MIAPTLRSELIVRMEGLEPPRREAPDPKSGAATNYATCAISIMKTKNIPFCYRTKNNPCSFQSEGKNNNLFSNKGMIIPDTF